MASRAQAVLVMVALVALTGCTSGNDTTTKDPSAASEIATVEDASIDGSDAAAREGVLTIVDGCLALDNGTVPVFVNGEGEWDGETLRFGDGTFKVGDTVRLTGSTFVDANGVSIPAGCDGMELWQVGGIALAD